MYVCTSMCVCVWCVYVHVQVYDATKRELDSLKKQLKEAEEESRTTRDKVSEGHSTAKSSRSFYSCFGLKSRRLPCVTAYSCKGWTRKALNRLTLS